MSKRGMTSIMSDDIHTPIPTLQPPKMEISMSTYSLMLTSTNYSLWAMRMEVSLEAHDLWRVIDGKEVNRKKDRLALLMILVPSWSFKAIKSTSRRVQKRIGRFLLITCENG